MNRDKWRIVSTIAFTVMLGVNGLAGGTTFLNGQDTAAVSDAFPTLFTPAGFTFAIWGVIYLFLTGFVLYQLGLFGKISAAKEKAIDAITPYFLALSVVNTAWIFAWQYEVIWLSVLLIVGMLSLLVKINELLRKQEYTTREKVLVKTPFSIYFGWVTVATVANICVWLVSVKWDAWGIDPANWLVIVLWVAALVGFAGMLRNRDWLYGAVFVWAYFGILFGHHFGVPLDSTTQGNLVLLIIGLAMMSGYMLRAGRDDNKSATLWQRLFAEK